LAFLGVLAIGGALTRLDTYSGPLLAALLVVPTLGLAAAPFNSIAAQQATLPAELGQRRRTEWQRDRQTVVHGAIAGGAVAAVAVVAILALMLAPSPHLVQPPNLVGPGPGEQATPTPAPSVSGSVTTTTPTPPATTPYLAPGASRTAPTSSTVPTSSTAPTSGPDRNHRRPTHRRPTPS